MSTCLMTEVFCIRDTYSTYSYPVVKDVNNSNFIFPSAVSTTCSTQLPNMVFLFPNSHISLYICDIKRPAAEFWRNQVCETKTDFVTKTNDWFCNAINCSYTPPFNTIAPNSFSDTHHALDSHFLFCEWCLQKNSFKIFLLSGTARWATKPHAAGKVNVLSGLSLNAHT
jgi:hypothetical protein